MVNLKDFIEESNLFKTLEVDDVLLVEYRCLVEEKDAPIWNHTNYFGYVTGGRKKWKTDLDECLVESGEALFVKRGSHTVYQYFEDEFKVLFIFFTDEFIQRTLAKYPAIVPVELEGNSKPKSLYPIRLNQVFDAFFQSLMTFMLEGNTPHQDLLRLKMEEFVVNLFTHHGNEELKQYLLELTRLKKINLEHIMLANYKQSLSMEEYARMSARSVSSFRRDFRRVFGTNPSEWILMKRLDFSRFLLETTDKAVLEIMDESGFNNRTHFSKVFKKRFGKPPLQFRQSRVV